MISLEINMASNFESEQLDSKERGASLRAGFDCEFLTPLSKDLLDSSECPVCLHIIREPQMVTCCGNSICLTCIQIIKAENKPCPICQERNFLDVEDKRLKRSLYAQKVYCSYKKNGCEWTGELGQLDKHLNTDPQPEKQLDGCQFAEIKCMYCQHFSPRKDISIHQTKKCVNRPFNCMYCNQYQSTFSDTMNNHWPVCGSFPVSCPNECGSNFKRQNLNSHVADECLLATISCDFRHVGCAVTLPRKDMPDHLKENLLTHISLLAISHGKQQEELTRLVAENETLQSKNRNLEHNYQSLETNHNNLQSEMKTLKNKLQKLQPGGVAQPMVQVDHQHKKSIPLGPSVLTMPNIEQHKAEEILWYSPPVYTHIQGYKLCLKVMIQPWGTQTYQITVSIHFMRGEFDDYLTWPFRGSIGVRLVDQVKGQGYKEDKINYTNDEDNNCCSRVVDGSIARYGKEAMTILISDNEDKGEKPKYLKNDTLVFQIFEVEFY